MNLIRTLQLGYGHMAEPVLGSFLSDSRFQIVGLVTPPIQDAIYRHTDELPQERLATENGVEVYRPKTLADFHRIVEQTDPDLVLIASYNKIIPSETLKLSKFVNVHHGKLPRQRGRANFNWAIINGETSVGVSVHEAVEELDAGDVLHQYTIPVGPTSDIGTVYSDANKILADSLPDLLNSYCEGTLVPQPQNQAEATYYCTRLPDDGMIDWHWPREKICNFVRALTRPFPGAFTYLELERLIVWGVQELDAPREFEGIVPGRVVGIRKGKGVEVLAGDGPLLITDVEGAGISGDPSQIIRSSRCTLGLSVHDLLRRLDPGQL